MKSFILLPSKLGEYFAIKMHSKNGSMSRKMVVKNFIILDGIGFEF